MAGIAGKSGRHKRADDRASENLEGLFLRLRSEILKKVWACKGALEHHEGVSLSKAEAVERILEAGCEALERTLAGSETSATISEISEISASQILKIAEISGDDMSVPGYGFPEDEEELPAPASYTNGMHAPALPVDVPQASETPSTASEPIVEQTPSGQTPAPQQEMLEPAIKTTPALSEDIVKIAEARAQYNRMSERAFTQLLFDRGIYRHKAKDGSEHKNYSLTVPGEIAEALPDGLRFVPRALLQSPNETLPDDDGRARR